MNIRNVALLVLLINISFQSEIFVLSQKEEIKEQIQMDNTNNNINNRNSFYNVLITLIVLSNYI